MWEDRRLRDITEADLRQIIDAQLEEHLQLEYKSALYEANDRRNKESLLDICMFANAGVAFCFWELRSSDTQTSNPLVCPIQMLKWDLIFPIRKRCYWHTTLA